MLSGHDAGAGRLPSLALGSPATRSFYAPAVAPRLAMHTGGARGHPRPLVALTGELMRSFSPDLARALLSE